MRYIIALVAVMLAAACTSQAATTTTTTAKAYSQDLYDAYAVYRGAIAERDLETFKASLSANNLALMTQAVRGNLDAEGFEDIASFGDYVLPPLPQMTILSETRNETHARWEGISPLRRGYVVFAFENGAWKIDDEIWDEIK